MKPSDSLKKSLLKDVARSFYLSLKVLPGDVRPVLSLGYLLCRAADTIADTPTTPLSDRKRLLARFKTLFSAFPVEESRLNEFLQQLAEANLTPKPNERKLLDRFADCAKWFNEMSKTDQSLIQTVVSAVITGMEIDLDVFGDPDPANPTALPSEKDLETYIHWIGGEPGRFWTNACLAHLPTLRISNRDQFLQDGIIFGTGLQMVNILRDVPADLKMGRCYIPGELLQKHNLSAGELAAKTNDDVFFTLYNDLIDQTLFRLERGFSYLTQLPRFAWGLRAAVAWPLIIGSRTLRRLRDNPSLLKSGEPVKISRGEVYRLVFKSLFLMPFNFWIKREVDS